jgi:DNA-binding LacI/PurR family transcriptional regulator
MAKQRKVSSQQIREIAAKAFMSTVTVVRVVDGEPRVMEATRLRVLAAMRELGIDEALIEIKSDEGVA